jgi:hypothetical protein
LDRADGDRADFAGESAPGEADAVTTTDDAQGFGFEATTQAFDEGGGDRS